jgi:hypothetical protein
MKKIIDQIRKIIIEDNGYLLKNRKIEKKIKIFLQKDIAT